MFRYFRGFIILRLRRVSDHCSLSLPVVEVGCYESSFGNGAKRSVVHKTTGTPSRAPDLKGRDDDVLEIRENTAESRLSTSENPRGGRGAGVNAKRVPKGSARTHTICCLTRRSSSTATRVLSSCESRSLSGTEENTVRKAARARKNWLPIFRERWTELSSLHVVLGYAMGGAFLALLVKSGLVLVAGPRGVSLVHIATTDQHLVSAPSVGSGKSRSGPSFFEVGPNVQPVFTPDEDVMEATVATDGDSTSRDGSVVLVGGRNSEDRAQMPRDFETRHFFLESLVNPSLFLAHATNQGTEAVEAVADGWAHSVW